MIIADTSGLLAFFNKREPRHAEVREVIDGSDDVLVVSPYVVAELDYLVATRLGVDAELEVLRELGGGAYELADFGDAALLGCVDVVERYRDQGIGVADASIVVLAERYDTKSVLTLDTRHFSVLRPRQGGRFKLLP